MFQSTPPLREATTSNRLTCRPLRMFQSTPPLREATVSNVKWHRTGFVSIHASLAGGDLVPDSTLYSAQMFQSTPPLREATL